MTVVEANPDVPFGYVWQHTSDAVRALIGGGSLQTRVASAGLALAVLRGSAAFLTDDERDRWQSIMDRFGGEEIEAAAQRMSDVTAEAVAIEIVELYEVHLVNLGRDAPLGRSGQRT